MKNLDQDKWLAGSQEKDAIILDVRTPQECEEGIIKGAQQLNIQDSLAFVEKVEKMDKDKHYYVYCRSGGRSGQACMIMNARGIQHTFNLEGGMLAWNGETVNP